MKRKLSWEKLNDSPDVWWLVNYRARIQIQFGLMHGRWVISFNILLYSLQHSPQYNVGLSPVFTKGMINSKHELRIIVKFTFKTGNLKISEMST